MAIEDDIKAAIDKNISAELGGRLKTRLQKAEDLEAENEILKKELWTTKQKLKASEEQLADQIALGRDLKMLEAKAEEVRKATVDKAVVDVTLTCANMRINDMKELVKDVFANNRYKYMLSESGMVPVMPGPQGQWPAQHSVTKTATIEGQGTP